MCVCNNTLKFHVHDNDNWKENNCMKSLGHYSMNMVFYTLAYELVKLLVRRLVSLSLECILDLPYLETDSFLGYLGLLFHRHPSKLSF